MNTFADYILDEKKLGQKMEIAYYLSKKAKVFFDKSTVFKTEIARLFLNYSKIEVDKNFVLTACILCNCKKSNNAKDIEEIHSYAKQGSKYLREIGFGKKFCKVCEEVNRYSKSNPREKESDILELVDQFGGMLLYRPERIGFKADEALVLLEHRNLKNDYNRYMSTFIDFVNFMENVKLKEMENTNVFKGLIKTYNETPKLTTFIEEVVNEYEPEVDKLIIEQNDKISLQMMNKEGQTNRPLFSQETAKKIMTSMYDEK